MRKADLHAGAMVLIGGAHARVAAAIAFAYVPRSTPAQGSLQATAETTAS